MNNSKSQRSSYGFLAPALISIFIFTVLPIVYSVYMSFTNYSLNTVNNYKLIGLQNYKSVISGPFKNSFIPVLGWNFIFALLSTVGPFILGLILALILANKNMKEAFIYKAILIIPWALPVTIAIMSWQGLFNTQYGALNLFLIKLHIIHQPIMWLANKWMARIALVIVNIWLGFPYMMNVSIGAISAIPDVYYEAAEIDGASKFTQFIKITLPSLAATSYPLLISSFAFNFTNFGSAYLITNGNPQNPLNQFAGYTDILVSVTYKLAINNNQFAIGATLGVLIFFIIGTISYVQMRLSGQFKEAN
ncbi:carbohydrate ABC transporter permease [Clostridium hydrogenum]|uniref:carbohydrate ABC transporter permease n=1 Tax=Clostridium hydrogenum TaxID=2855764 RepID=UPI001F1E47B5|nr:sugar ABC transporter permease [Clostridium hydrogenum]